MKFCAKLVLLDVFMTLCLMSCANLPSHAQDSGQIRALDEAFHGAKLIDLRTSNAKSVVKLRKIVRIPPSSTPVFVKIFDRASLPPVLQDPFFAPSTMGLTIASRYIAVIRTGFPQEERDILNHELVHAYISLASPKPLPFWFQEASAVHFSTDSGTKMYGRPSEDIPGATEGKVVELTDTYKQKLQSFRFLIDQVGEKPFQKWYRNAVLTGNVDARPLLGLSSTTVSAPPKSRMPWIWFAAPAGLVVIAVLIMGYNFARPRLD